MSLFVFFLLGEWGTLCIGLKTSKMERHGGLGRNRMFEIIIFQISQVHILSPFIWNFFLGAFFLISPCNHVISLCHELAMHIPCLFQTPLEVTPKHSARSNIRWDSRTNHSKRTKNTPSHSTTELSVKGESSREHLLLLGKQISSSSQNSQVERRKNIVHSRALFFFFFLQNARTSQT